MAPVVRIPAVATLLSDPRPASLTMAGQVDHPLFARLYVGQSQKADARGLAARRAEMLDRLAGRVLEIGAGNGMNFRHYPPRVTEVVAVEPEPNLRELAIQAALVAPVPVRVVDGLAEQLPFEDGEFDAAVASLVLCSIGDAQAALTELHRVVMRDGELRFLEHVASERRVVRSLQRAADATLWPRVAGGCHLARDTARLIEDAGFAIERCERFAFGISPLDPPKSHILGAARKIARDDQDPRSRPLT